MSDIITCMLLYFGASVIILGILIGAKQRNGSEPTGGDLIAALVWPATILLLIGVSLGMSGDKK